MFSQENFFMTHEQPSVISEPGILEETAPADGADFALGSPNGNRHGENGHIHPELAALLAETAVFTVTPPLGANGDALPTEFPFGRTDALGQQGSPTEQREHEARASFDMQRAVEQAINPFGNDNPELVALLREELKTATTHRVDKFARAKEKKAELGEENPAASRIATVETVLQKIDPKVVLSLTALALGDTDRFTKLVSEYLALADIREKRLAVLRGVGEYFLRHTRGIPKSMLVASHMRDVPNDTTGLLTPQEERLIPDVSSQFAKAARRLAIATKSANADLESVGQAEFSLELYTEALRNHEDGLEAHQAEAAGHIKQDFSQLRLQNGQLRNDTLQVLEGVPFSEWQRLPVTPLLMKNKEFKQVDPASKEAAAETANNIMLVLESGQVSNHGAHVRIAPDVRAKMVSAIQMRVEKGEPIQLELYYTLARMSNPLEGVRRTPGLQEWAMFYKFAQVTKTAELFYQPTGGQPPIQWVVIDEANAFGDVWDLDQAETKEFRNQLREMFGRMGISDTIIFDDLQRMVDKGGENVANLIKNNYQRIAQNWQDFLASGISFEDYIARDRDWIQTLQNSGEADTAASYQTRIADVQTIHDREISMMRLVNPVRHHPDMTVEDLLAVYNGIMPHVNLGDIQLTDRQQAILADIQARALHANIYSKAVMDARVAMERGYPKAVSVTITDKTNKLVVFTGAPGAQVFPGHAEAIAIGARRSSFGSPELANDWLNVCRASGVLAERIDNKRNRYRGVIDPENPHDPPYYYLQEPTTVSKAA